jgi:type IV fimbrial biogenesis protein FimT
MVSRMRLTPRPASGTSLWEMLACLALAATVAALVLPSFSLSSARGRLVASHNILLASLHYARSTAILTNLPTALCLSHDGLRCSREAGAPVRGWLVFQDLARRGAVEIDAADTLLRHVALPAPVTVRGSRAAVTYWPVARAGTTSTFLLCHAGHAQAARAIVVSQSGRPRTALDGAWPGTLRCPA